MANPTVDPFAPPPMEFREAREVDRGELKAAIDAFESKTTRDPFLESRQDATPIQPLKDKPELTPELLSGIEDFVAGRTDTPPVITGLRTQAPATPTPYQPTIQTPEAPVAPQAPAPQVPDHFAAFMQTQAQQNALLQAQIEQQQALLQQFVHGQQQALQRTSPQFEAQEMAAAGYDYRDPKDVMAYRSWQQNQALEQRLGEMEQRYQALQWQAQSLTAEHQLAEHTRQTLRVKFADREIPAETIQAIAKQAAALAPTFGVDQALQAAMAGYVPLISRLPAKQAKKAAPEALPVHPGLEQLRQLPQFSRMTPEQLMGTWMSMQATSVQGAGGGRHTKPITLEQLEDKLFR